MPLEVVARFDQQYQRSLAKGLWKGAYSASNPDEFFAELTMWYFGTHGDLNMTGPKPENGPEGFKKYDPEAYALFDDFYSGRIPIGKMDSGGHEWTSGSSATNPPAAFRNSRRDVNACRSLFMAANVVRRTPGCQLRDYGLLKTSSVAHAVQFDPAAEDPVNADRVSEHNRHADESDGQHDAECFL